MIKVYIFAPVFFPAVNAGGPVPALLGITEELSAEDVTVVANDRDLGAKQPFDLPYRGKTLVGKSNVIYLNSNFFRNMKGWMRQLDQSLKTDVVYLNSIFSASFSLLPLVTLWMFRFQRVILISPRGELAPSALVLGRFRLKRIWLKILSFLVSSSQIKSKVHWIASSPNEEQDIFSLFPSARVHIVPEKLRSASNLSKVNFSTPDPLEIVCVGRVAPVKGILRLFESFCYTNLNINLKIIGYLEDDVYVSRLKEKQAEFNSNITIQWLGPLVQEQLMKEIINSHLSVSLTFGENFGHSIGEALQLGIPVFISDQTPWTENVLNFNAGFVLSDNECNIPQIVAEVFMRFTQLTIFEHKAMSENAKIAALSNNRENKFSEVVTQIYRETDIPILE